jgi:hypothetical protein
MPAAIRRSTSTSADQAAVHLAGGVGPEAAFDGEEHRLVEMPEPFGDLTPVDEDPPHRLEGFGFEVRCAQRPAEGDDGRGQRMRPVELATTVGRLGFPQQQRAVLATVGVVGQRPAGPPQPGAGHGPGWP